MSQGWDHFATKRHFQSINRVHVSNLLGYLLYLWYRAELVVLELAFALRIILEDSIIVVD